MRSDKSLVHASKGYSEALSNTLAQQQGCGALFVAFEVDVCMVTDNLAYRNVCHDPSLKLHANRSGMFARISTCISADVRSCGVDRIAAALSSNAGIWIEWKLPPMALAAANFRVAQATHPVCLTKQGSFCEPKLDGNATPRTIALARGWRARLDRLRDAHKRPRRRRSWRCQRVRTSF